MLTSLWLPFAFRRRRLAPMHAHPPTATISRLLASSAPSRTTTHSTVANVYTSSNIVYASSAPSIATKRSSAVSVNISPVSVYASSAPSWTTTHSTAANVNTSSATVCALSAPSIAIMCSTSTSRRLQSMLRQLIIMDHPFLTGLSGP